MLKQHSSFVKQTIAAFDCFLMLLAFYIANVIVFGFSASVSRMFDYWMMIVGFTFFYLYFAWTRSLFSVMYFNWMHGLYRRVVAIFLSAGFLGAAILFLVQKEQYSRYLYIVFTLLSFVFIVTEKYLIKRFIENIRKNNKNTTPIILFGRGREASQIYQEIISHPEWGFRVIRKLDMSITASEFEEVLKNRYVEEVFFCLPRKITSQGFSIDPYLQICEDMGRPARVFLNIS
ncbi:MAG: hypothetical protein OQK82_04790, partial [Candidatus Pacearchaeota archaeon]|nr:hypothetical protein [Candidatus Pacearchaeota archaeon]